MSKAAAVVVVMAVAVAMTVVVRRRQPKRRRIIWETRRPIASEEGAKVPLGLGPPPPIPGDRKAKR